MTKFGRAERRLLAGNALSAISTWIDFLAILSLAAFTLNGTPLQMVLVTSASLLPGILLSPILGRLADLHSPRRIIIIATILRAIATGGIMLSFNIWWLCVILFLRSSVSASLIPATNALTISTISEAQRPRYFAYLNGMNSMAKIVVPAVGTLAAAAWGEASVLCVSIALSIFSILFYFQVGGVTKAGQSLETKKTNPDYQLAKVWPIVAINLSFFAYVFMVNNQLPILVKEGLLDKGMLGVFVGASGAGNVIGAWLFSRVSLVHPKSRGLVGLQISMVLPAAGFLALGILFFQEHTSINLASICIVFSLTGISSAWFSINSNVYLADKFSKFIGAVSGVIQSVQHATMLAAPTIGGLIIEYWGGEYLFLAAAVVGLVLCSVLFMALRIRRRNEIEKIGV